MSALTKGRDFVDADGHIIRRTGRLMKSGKTFYANAMVALSGGYLQPCTGTFGEQVVGIINLSPTLNSFVTSGADGAQGEADVLTGVFPFAIGASADALTQADAGARVFAMDDQTVGKTDGGVRRPVAGQLIRVVGSVAYVAIAFETPDASAAQAQGGLGAAGVPDAASVTGNLSLVDTTLWSISGTTNLTLPNGTVVGQRKRVVVVASGSTPVGSIIVTTPRGFATITTISGIGSFFELVWTATGWILGPTRGGTIA